MSAKFNKDGKEYPVGIIPQNYIRKVDELERQINALGSGTITLPYASQYYCLKDITVPSGAKVVANFVYGIGAYNKASGVMISNLTDTTARIIAFSSDGSFASGDSVDVNYICF